MRSEVGAAAPLILFPIKAGRPADSDFERPTQKSGLHQFLDGFHWNPHAIEIAFEPEPGIEPENPFVFRNRGLHRFTLGNSPAHGLLAPDILAGFGGRDGNQRVPVWRGRDMHDVDVFAGKNFAEILVTFHVVATRFDRGLEMLFIDVANREQFAGGVDGFDVAHSHATGADDRARQDFTGRSESCTAQNVPRDDGQGGQRPDGCFQEIAAT